MEDGHFMALTALITGLYGKLKAKGLLTDLDIQEIFDAPTLLLEEMGVQDNRTATVAHNFLSSIRTTFEQGQPKSGV